MDIELLDGIITALMAAAATSRARTLGAGISGATALGCLCGLVYPLIREAFLHGQPGMAMALRAMPDDALIGALGGLSAMQIAGGRGHAIFFWLDSAAMGFAGSLGCALAIPDLGIVGALVVGMATALSPGFVRDVAMGDIAMLVENNWYVAAVFIGSISCICLLIIAPAMFPADPSLEHAAMIAIFAGSCVTILLRRMRGYVEH